MARSLYSPVLPSSINGQLQPTSFATGHPCACTVYSGFGGRSEAGCAPPRDSTGRTACSCDSQTASTSPITPVRSASRGGEPAQIFAERGDPSARAAGREGRSRWVVETDGDTTIGPEGKVTLRARFVAAPCSGRGHGHSSVCGVRCAPEEWLPGNSSRSGNIGRVTPRSGVSGGAARDRPLLMLLRVFVVEDEAMALLGRRVSRRIGCNLWTVEGGGLGTYD